MLVYFGSEINLLVVSPARKMSNDVSSPETKMEEHEDGPAEIVVEELLSDESGMRNPEENLNDSGSACPELISGRSSHSRMAYHVLDDLQGGDDDVERYIEDDYDGDGAVASEDDNWDASYDDDDDEDEYEDDNDDIPEEEIDALLDQKLEEHRKRKRACRDEDGHELLHEEREKIIMKVRGQDHFEILPEGWIEVTHNSGMPVYLHKQTRVCTLSKPYFLGPGSARKHEPPIAAIPCYQYKLELEKEKEEMEAQLTQQQQTAIQSNGMGSSDSASEDASTSKSGPGLPNAKVETVLENAKEKSIGYLQLREYCQRLFEFKTIKVRRFRTWAGRRKHQKMMKKLQRPTLPMGTKLITCPLPSATDKEGESATNPRRAEFVMNPNGKSYVCILHEYVQHAMRVQPRYIFRELENSCSPYGATVVINGMEYGSGFGSSKKHAKTDAAKATLEILIPQMRNINPEDPEEEDLAFFDEIKVEDPRVSELCAKAGQPSPYQILLECLKRNYGMGDTQIKFEMKTLKHQKNEFTMRVGKHEVKVICKNKRDGKQRASQAILKCLHSHIITWGSMLRLYGKGSWKTLKEKKQEEQEITELQCKTTANKPNQSILNKLKEEMLKLKKKQEQVKPIGTFVPPDVEPPSFSASDLKNVEL